MYRMKVSQTHTHNMCIILLWSVIGGLIPLHNACSFGHTEVVRHLLVHGANPNALDNWNFTPLHEAAIKGKADVCVGMWFVCLFVTAHMSVLFVTVHMSVLL